MTILQFGTQVFSLDATVNRFKRAPLQYSVYPDTPSPDAYNEAVTWLEGQLAAWNTGLTILLEPQGGAGGAGVMTGTLVAHLVDSGGTQRHEMGTEQICVAITNGTTAQLAQTLKGELQAAGFNIP